MNNTTNIDLFNFNQNREFILKLDPEHLQVKLDMLSIHNVKNCPYVDRKFSQLEYSKPYLNPISEISKIDIYSTLSTYTLLKLIYKMTDVSDTSYEINLKYLLCELQRIAISKEETIYAEITYLPTDYLVPTPIVGESNINLTTFALQFTPKEEVKTDYRLEKVMSDNAERIFIYGTANNDTDLICTFDMSSLEYSQDNKSYTDLTLSNMTLLSSDKNHYPEAVKLIQKWLQDSIYQQAYIDLAQIRTAEGISDALVDLVKIQFREIELPTSASMHKMSCIFDRTVPSTVIFYNITSPAQSLQALQNAYPEQVFEMKDLSNLSPIEASSKLCDHLTKGDYTFMVTPSNIDNYLIALNSLNLSYSPSRMFSLLGMYPTQMDALEELFRKFGRIVKIDQNTK